MREWPERWLFFLSVATAAAVLVSIAASQILLAITLLVWILARPGRIRWPGYLLPLAAFMLTSTVALLASPDPGAGLPAIRKFVLFSIGPLASTFVIDERRYSIFIKVLVAVAVVASVIGMIQFAGYYSGYLLEGTLDNDPVNLARITGPVGHWMTFSGQHMLIWSALLPAAWILGTRWNRLLVSFFAVTLLLTLTRSVWVGALAAVFVVIPYLGSRALLKLVIPIGLMAILIPTLLVQRISIGFQEGGFAPDQARLDMIGAGLRMVGANPLFGVGPNRTGTEFSNYYRGDELDSFYYGHLHNNFIQIAAERGLFCLVSILWLFAKMATDLARFARSDVPRIRWTAVSGLSVLTAFVVGGLFEYNFGDSEVFMLFLFLISIPYGIARAPHSR